MCSAFFARVFNLLLTGMKIHLPLRQKLMKKIFLVIVVAFIASATFAQDEPKPEPKKQQPTLKSRANDHFLLQFGITNWAKNPDSINTKGFSRSFNMYFMFDFPFKSNPKISVAIGAGVGTDNIYFEKTFVGIRDLTPTLVFHDLTDTSHFKKYKLGTAFLEAPLELRFSSRPATPNKSFKVAIGIKGGIFLAAKTKGKTLQNASGGTINDFMAKESSKRFFNSNRFAATTRIGYGVFSVFGTYQLNALFKEGLGPDVRPFTIGLTLSGL
jgi:Outer membrane protein beta-barrel domain